VDNLETVGVFESNYQLLEEALRLMLWHTTM
jgi:hypothetical protein